MATKQYIGARYVPIIAGEYDPAQVYEPLTIVLYNNTSYTSKKTVPAGIVPTNTEYWALTGNYNGQVEAYREEVVALSKEFEQKQPTLFIGDSYGASNVVEPTWITETADNLGIALSDRYIYAETAAGFVVPGSNDHKFVDLLNIAANEIDNPLKIRRIIVAGGMNDRSQTKSSITSAKKDFADQALVKSPNAHFYLACIGNGNIAEYRTPIYNNARFAYLNSVASNLSVLFGPEYVMNNRSYYQSDNVHPNADGSKALGKAISAAIYGSFKPYTEVETIILDPTDAPLNQFGSGNGSMYMQMVGDVTTLRLSNFITHNATDTINLEVGTDLLIGKIPTNKGFIVGNNTTPMSAPIMCEYVNSNTGDIYSDDPTFLYIRDDSVYIRHFKAGATRTINQLQIKDQTLTLSTAIC